MLTITLLPNQLLPINGNERQEMAGKNISTKQRRAISALLTSTSVVEAAKITNVSVRTLHRWIAEDKQFKEALYHAEEQLIDNATRRLINLQNKALNVLDDLLESESEPVKRLTAVNILKFSFEFRYRHQSVLGLSELDVTKLTDEELKEIVKTGKVPSKFYLE